MRQTLHIILLLLSSVIPSFLCAQDINGYVVTKDNIVIRGNIRILADQQGKKISVNDGKSYFTRTFYINELNAYAHKKDTFAILNSFHPFEGEDYLAESVEAKVLVSKGELKLYYVTFADYGSIHESGSDYNTAGFTYRTSYKTYVIEYSNNFYGVKNGDQESFIKSISLALADNEALLKRIKSNEFKYKDMKKIISIYSASKS
jgi:hypothetical protein